MVSRLPGDRQIVVGPLPAVCYLNVEIIRRRRALLSLVEEVVTETPSAANRFDGAPLEAALPSAPRSRLDRQDGAPAVLALATGENVQLVNIADVRQVFDRHAARVAEPLGQLRRSLVQEGQLGDCRSRDG